MQEQHKWLLKASLLNGEEAAKAYEKWKQVSDIENLNHGEARLLPLLSQNLQSLKIKDELTEKIKGMHRHAFLSTSRRVHQSLPVFRTLNEKGIRFIALKGLAMNLAVYSCLSLRPMEDIDFLVPKSRIADVIDLLKEMGYQTYPPTTVLPFYFDYHHSIGFINQDRHIIDVHATISDECCSDGDAHPFHQLYETIEYLEIPFRVPQKTELLFHTIIHGMRWNPTLPLRWAADASAILDSSAIDWERMLKYAKEYRVVLPFLEGLTFLKEELDQPVPDHLLNTLASLPVSSSEVREYRFHQSEYNGAIASMVHHWDRYRHLGYKESFPAFCRRSWGIEHSWQFPLEAFKKMRKKFYWISNHTPQED